MVSALLVNIACSIRSKNVDIGAEIVKEYQPYDNTISPCVRLAALCDVRALVDLHVKSRHASNQKRNPLPKSRKPLWRIREKPFNTVQRTPAQLKRCASAWSKAKSHTRPGGLPPECTDVLQFNRAAKVGSTTMVKIYDEIYDKQGCEKLHLWKDTVPFGHDRTRDFDAVAHNPRVQTFAILRDPCQRFVSIFDHLANEVPSLNLKRFSNATQWGRYLLSNQTEWRRWSYHGDFRLPSNQWPLRFAWAQSAYVAPDTETVCLDTFAEGLVKLLKKYMPNCDIFTGKTRELMATHARQQQKTLSSHIHPDDETCRIARQLYPADFELYTHRGCME